MHYYDVAPKQITRKDSDYFTYSSDIPLPIGLIVKIEVGKKQLIGVVIKEVSKPSYPTKPVGSAICDVPLPHQLVELSRWISEYYVTPLATTLQTILPSGIDKNRRLKSKTIQEIVSRNRTNIVLNDEQMLALKTFFDSKPGTFLLQGVTGSGKTELYINMAKQAIDSGLSVIILVPEIALTSQLISEFSKHFNDLLVTHSKMTEADRHIVWKEAISSESPRVVIGPRSAIFSPLKNIGLIIIDEAHEPSFKQEQSPKYLALRVATVLGRLHGAKVVFGSATPSIVDRYLAEQTKTPILTLTKPARNNVRPPKITLVDMRQRENFRSHRFLSDQLIEQISNTLSLNEQCLLFHNRRGSASTTLCKQCGWMAECPKCFLPLTLHADLNQLECHVCGFTSKVPTSCPVCSGTDIVYKGIGTKLIESELRRLFPDANIARFDADNHSEGAVNSRYKELYDGTIDIIIGTQVIAKGLDLPHLRTVGVIQADAGLALPDFCANERTFQLLAQVVGRVGRNENETNVVIQTYQPKHTAIINGLSQDYESFFSDEIKERRCGNFPPFTHMLRLECSYKTEQTAIKNSRALMKILREQLNKSVQILGPTPAFYERQGGSYHWRIILKSAKRNYLTDALKLIPAKSWQFDLDPSSLL